MAVVELRLYGRLRRHAPARDPRGESVLALVVAEGEPVAALLGRAGLDRRAVSHIFVNGTLCRDWTRPLADRDRVGVFPEDMALLYV